MFGITKWEDYPDCLSPEGVATLNCIPVVFQNFVAALLAVVGAVSLIMIIVSGYKYMTARGDAKQLEGAKHTLFYAIIGLVVVLFSFLIINLIADLTGVGKCIQFFNFKNCE